MTSKPLVVALVTVTSVASAAFQQTSGAVPSAGGLVTEAVGLAKADQKTVFVDFRASWCAPCAQMQRFLVMPEVKPIIDANFIVVPINIWEEKSRAHFNNPGAEALMRKLGGKNAIPFFAFLDTEGRRLANGDGFPSGSFAIDDFVQTLSRAAPRLTAQEREALFDAIASMTRRRVWAAPAGDLKDPAVSPTARFLAYSRAGAKGVFVHDFVAGVDRRVADDVPIGPAVFSQNGRRLAFAVRLSGGGFGLRVAGSTGAPAATSVLEESSATRLEPLGWSDDGNSLVFAVTMAQQPSLKLATVAVGGGPVVDRYVFAARIERLILSPDGRRLAVEQAETQANRTSLWMLLMAKGGPERLAANLDGGRLLGWSADGSYVLFHRRRADRVTFHTVDVRDGHPRTVKEAGSEKGPTDKFSPIGLAANGTLYYRLESSVTEKSSIWVLGDLFSTPVSRLP